MKIGALKETFRGEARVAMTPDSAAQLQKMGHACFVEAGAGAAAGFPDESFRVAGVAVLPDARAFVEAVDVIAKVRPPEPAELSPEIDILISTALLPGRPAPKLWPTDMVEAMKPGSVSREPCPIGVDKNCMRATVGAY